MKTYKQFHGEILISDIGKELRTIAKREKSDFKIMTGYGSLSGTSQSKIAAIKSLSKMKKEGLIKDFFPGEVKSQVLLPTSQYYEVKLTYEKQIKSDSDYGNDGIIFVFLRWQL